MPNRILREGILTSERVNSLSMPAELFFRRLMSVADDFGRYDGRLCLIRVACYPLRVDEVTDKDVEGWMKEVEKMGLISTYFVGKKPYLAVTDFNQRTRAKNSKFPAPSDSCQTHDGHVTDSGGHVRTETETETDTHTETVSPSGGQKTKRVPLPKAWKPKPYHEKHAKSAGVNLEAAHEMFEDWAVAGGNTYADWDRCFTNALKNWLPDRIKSAPKRTATDATGDKLRRMGPNGWEDAA